MGNYDLKRMTRSEPQDETQDAALELATILLVLDDMGSTEIPEALWPYLDTFRKAYKAWPVAERDAFWAARVAMVPHD